MDRRHSILIALLIAVTIGCGSPKSESSGNTSPGNPPSSNSPTASALPTTAPPASTEGGALMPTGSAPSTLHTVSLSTSTNPGSLGSPSIVTCISESGGDTMAWKVPSGTIFFPSGTNLTVYTPTCSGTECQSGKYSVNSVNCPTLTCVGKTVDYTIQTGSTVIYGHIIINK